MRTPELIEYQGRILTTRQWAQEFGMRYRTLVNRLNRGHTFERALTQTVRPLSRDPWGNYGIEPAFLEWIMALPPEINLP